MDIDAADDDDGKRAVIIVAIVMAVPLTAILANQAPQALLALIVVGFLAWAGVRSGILAKDEGDAGATSDVDPLVTLQERYATGEISEEEFEHRLDRILRSDEQAATSTDDFGAGSREREPASERG